MRFIIKYMPQRKKYLDDIKKQIPEIEVIEDVISDHTETFLRSLQHAGDDPCVHMEDDVILCIDFKRRIISEIQKRPNQMIQFFSRRTKDQTLGSREDYGGNFLANLCVYYPKGYSKMIRDFYVVWEEKFIHPTGTDIMIADFLRLRKEKYYIVVPNLVDHAIDKSLIDKKRSSKRQSKTFRSKL